MISRKSDFFKEWSVRTGLSQKDLASIYQSMYEIIVESVNSEEESVTVLPNIGKLKVKTRAPYVGRNPNSAEKIMIPAQRRCHLSLNQSFKEVLNKKL